MSGRKPGDTNYSDREKKHKAQIAALKAEIAAEKAKRKAKDAELAETRNKLREAWRKAKKDK